MKKSIVLFLLISSQGVSQELKIQESNANKWLDRYDQMPEYFQIPDETISRKNALKAKEKILKIIQKSIQKSIKNPDDPAVYDQLFIANANASLWHNYIQGDHFSRLLNRLTTSTQIGRDHIHDVRDAYHKWITNPTPSNLDKYSVILLRTGRSYAVLCDLQVVDKLTDGSRINYQPINGTRLRTMDSSGVKRVPVGNYYIWIEKEGKIFSEHSDAKFCITKKQQVSIRTL